MWRSNAMKLGVKSGVREGFAVPASYQTPSVKCDLICTPFSKSNRRFNPSFLGGVRVAHHFSFLLCCPIMWHYAPGSLLLYSFCFPHEHDVRFVFTPSCLYKSSCMDNPEKLATYSTPDINKR
jgi:hypothetical protein